MEMSREKNLRTRVKKVRTEKKKKRGFETEVSLMKMSKVITFLKHSSCLTKMQSLIFVKV